VYDLLTSRFGDIHTSLTAFALNPQGWQVSPVSVGITLIFAPFLWLFGNHAIWIVPVVWDIALLCGLFFTTRLFFRDKGAAAWVWALLAVAMYGTVINFRLSLRRDIACAALLSIASLLALLGVQKKKALCWHGVSALLCFISIVKPNQAMLFVPCVLLWINSMRGAVLRVKSVVFHGAAALVVACVIFMPFFLQNHAASGRWYSPVQLSPGKQAMASLGTGLPRKALAAIADVCSAQGYIYSPKGLPKWCSIPFVLLALLGAWAQRKSPFVRYWALPVVFLEYAFMIFWVIPWHDYAYTYNTYLAPVYPVGVFLAACGIHRLVRDSRRVPAVLWLLAAAFLLPFFSVKVYRSLPGTRHVRFRLPEVARLSADLSRVIPDRSVLLCDRFLCFTIDYFTKISCFPPKRLDDAAAGINEKVAYLIDKGVPVFFCDYRGIEGSYTYRSTLEKGFSLVPVARDRQLYGYPSVFFAPPFSIFRVDKRPRS
jgi:hypothetical protein